MAGAALEPGLVRRLCDHHLGIGSDGVLEVVAADGDAGRDRDLESRRLDRPRSPATGRGSPRAGWPAARTPTRCESRSARARWQRRSSAPLEVEMDMGAVEVQPIDELDVDGTRLEFTPVSVGNPHAVIVHDPDRSDLLRLGPLVERHPRFPSARTSSSSASTRVATRRPASGSAERGRPFRPGRAPARWRPPRLQTAGARAP